MQSFEQEFASRIKGEVRFDEISRGLYATDASIYQIKPIAVVTPKDEQDVQTAVDIAARHGVAILPRGGGTSLAGQTVGACLVIDFSKYMNKVLQLNVKERWVRVQPGLVRDELNAVLAPHGLHFAPDPATANRANIGGMIGNNSSGTKSILFGKTVDHVLETKVLLADGTVLHFRKLSGHEYASKAESAGREGEIHKIFQDIITENREEIARRFPKVMRRVGGYNLDEFIHTTEWNLSKLMVGSEGTLATLLEAKLHLEPLPKATALCVVHFHDLLEAIGAVRLILTHTPSAVEILDHAVVSLARENLSTRRMSDFLIGDPAAILIVEFYGETEDEVKRKTERMVADLQDKNIGSEHPVLLDKDGQAQVWSVRKNGLGLMLGMQGKRKPLPFIEDACIPVEVLQDYIAQVMQICRELDTGVAMYAHASVGVIHVRPILDLREQGDIERMVTIANRTFNLVRKYAGSWCGEHGDGLVRSAFNEKFFGKQVYEALRRIKTLFDPANLMNPGKIVNAPSMDRNLRYGAGYRDQHIPTVFRYRHDGAFQDMVHMCTGVGACRKIMGGTMCPSYIATREEKHSTRGRANALRLAMSGQLGESALSGKPLHDVLDLCLSCKGCKSECPSNVDMAKLKSEFLQHYHDKHGLSLRDRLVRDSARTASLLAGPMAPVVNWLQKTKPARMLLERFVGFHHARVLPALATVPFHKWFAGRPRNAGGKRVALFCDTYMDYYEPHIGRAAVALLESCGYQVTLARTGCCQRPRLSHGFLRDAKRDGETTLRGLDAHIRRGMKVVTVEPSCASALNDDLPDLMDDAGLAERIVQNVMMIDIFLDQEIKNGVLTCKFTSPSRDIMIHGHCHQKSLYGTAPMKNILAGIDGMRVHEVDSGCCGMAGSFGYEKEHYALSKQVGEDRLFPAVRACRDATIVACGFSCRHQLEHCTGRKAVHWVETLRGNPADWHVASPAHVRHDGRRNR